MTATLGATASSGVGTAVPAAVGLTAAQALPYPGDEWGELDALRDRIRDGRQALAHAFDVLRDAGAGLQTAWHGDEADLATEETSTLIATCREAVRRADRAAGAVDDHAVTIRQVRARVDAARELWTQGRDRLIAVTRAQLSSPEASPLCIALSGRSLDDCEFAEHAVANLTSQARQQMADAEGRWRGQVRRAEASAQDCIAVLLAACAGSEVDLPGLRGTHLGLADTIGAGALLFDDRVRARFGRGTWSTLSSSQRAYYLALARAELGPGRAATGWSLSAAWARLDPLCRQALIHHDPARWGNADGLPAADRDQANRLALAAALATIRADTAGVDPPSPPTGDDPDARAASVAATLAAAGYGPAQIRAARGTLAVAFQLARASAHPRHGAPTQLLIFQPGAYDGRGRAAITLGDAGTAGNVALLVPGMTSEVPGHLGDQMTSAISLFDAAGRDSTDRTAVVAYVGYRAPDLGWDAADQDLADAGAPAVAADIAGMHLMRTAGPAHLTVIAHSYGSTTTATAFSDGAAGGGPGVTDLVLIGSPGAGRASSAADLGLPTGHVWVGSASSDPVTTVVQQAQDRGTQGTGGCVVGALVGGLIGLPGGPGGVAAGASIGCGVGGTGTQTTATLLGADLGQDPAAATFGGTRFASETQSDSRFDIANHSQYYRPRSESLANIAHIVVGDYSAVTTVQPRPESGTHYDGVDPAAAHVPVFPAPGG